MFAIIGIVVVIGAILGGYLMEHGNVKILIQPAELLIIGGAAAGTVLIANPLHILKQIASGLVVVFKGSKFTKQRYIESLRLTYELLNKARRQGLMSLETDTEDPEKSPIFSKDPEFLKDPEVRYFFCDSMRMAISGVEAFELDQLMDLDLDVHHHEASIPVASLSTMADSLPGLGIVAAVLGVVITMGALGGPPEEIGHKVAAAPVGTFLGILLCYGFVGPMASSMSKAADEERAYLGVLKVVVISFLKGTAPIMAVEAARRAIPGHVRPNLRRIRKSLPRRRRSDRNGSSGRSRCLGGIANGRRARHHNHQEESGHSGHHGGAWKVAYADFVTAMMALFIVLWLLNTSKPVKEAIAGYFRDPSGTAGKLGTSAEGPGEKFVPTPVPNEDMGKLKDEIEKAMRRLPNFDKFKNQIEIKVTPEGLRIELLESATGTFFDLGSHQPNSNGSELLDMLAGELGKLPNKISIEGHTDSKPFSGKRNYGNWELSTDRANSARRLMQEQGLGGKQVAQVRGFADQLLRIPKNPNDPSNRRISLIVQYLDNTDKETGETMEKVNHLSGSSDHAITGGAAERS